MSGKYYTIQDKTYIIPTLSVKIMCVIVSITLLEIIFGFS